MRKRRLLIWLVLVLLLLLAAFSETAQAKKQKPTGNWRAIESLGIGTPISVKARHSVHLLCYFERATEQQLFCQPLRPAVPVIAPWPYPGPFPYPPYRLPEYTFTRDEIEEVRLEHSEAVNELSGSAIGAAAGAAFGAATVKAARGAGALIFGLVGAGIGGVLGRTSPLFHRKVIYRR